MKAICLWEPWASLMAVGAKTIETRSRAIKYRGDLLICAAKHQTKAEEMELASKWLWAYREKFRGYIGNFHDLWDGMPFGRAVCVVEVYDCLPASSVYKSISIEERQLGDYHTGRWAWLTKNVQRIREPFPVQGKQFFFDVSDELVKAALREKPSPTWTLPMPSQK
jgi:activating signal cointegrator 1